MKDCIYGNCKYGNKKNCIQYSFFLTHHNASPRISFFRFYQKLSLPDGTFRYALIQTSRILPENACYQVNHIMLFGKLGGCTNQCCHHKRTSFVPARYLTALSYSDEAEPAYQTMDGWKEIRRCIRCIDKTHQPATEIMPCHFRSDIRGWKQYKEDTADYS